MLEFFFYKLLSIMSHAGGKHLKENSGARISIKRVWIYFL